MGNFILRITNIRVFVVFIHDILISIISFWLAVYLRFGAVPQRLLEDVTFNRFFFISIFINILVFTSCGLYRGVWRYSSIFDLFRVIKASLAAVSLSLITCFFMTRLVGIPRTMFVIELLLLITGLGGGRLAYRFLKDNNFLRKLIGSKNSSLNNILIVGAGRAGESLLRDIMANPDLELNVVGFLDDDKYKKNRFIHNKKVFGGTDLISHYLETYKIKKVFIAIPNASGSVVKKIATHCEKLGVEVKILPKIDQYLSTSVGISLLRNINIEDLLGRAQVKLETQSLSEMINQKIILVSGAGGSIGQELCVQIAHFKPSLLVLCDFCELFMFELENKLRCDFPELKIIPKIVDIRDRDKMDSVFNEYKPQIVFHAAAYKHVPMMEYNPREAIDTNVVGTKNIAELTMAHNVDKFVMISTDKAVNPTNVMGASKRIAEMIITDLSSKSSHTKFISVRFGNVLGSNGSVIPIFKRQIENGKNITVTHPDIIRYFMSIPEASQLVLQAASMGDGGEIFVLDMGEPVKIVDLAKTMISLAGLELGKDIEIEYSGLRPGEKLYEELFSESESYEFTHHGKIRKAIHRKLDSNFNKDLYDLISSAASIEEIIARMKILVPEFNHNKLL
ncbi:nucleoside-diphosphate sugar epimerase/dehydratase [Halobacteriovorax sp. RZ-3]|uniref:polysaccharide biosynthesis protein n=1 Tax=Halobacteriovorax sp. RZ-3 TaxID=3157720 RepID=UPI003715379E